MLPKIKMLFRKNSIFIFGYLAVPMVGTRGFEPPPSCTPSKRANQSAPRPDTNLHLSFIPCSVKQLHTSKTGPAAVVFLADELFTAYSLFAAVPRLWSVPSLELMMRMAKDL